MSKLLQEHNHLIKRALTTAKASDVYLVLRIQQMRELTLSYKNQRVDRTSLTEDVGVGMYAFTKSGHVAFGSTNQLDLQSIDKLVRQLADVARANEKAGFCPAAEIYSLEPQENIGEDNLHYQVAALDKYSPTEIGSYIKTFDDYIQSIDPAVKTMWSYRSDDEQWRIVRSDGTDVDFSLPKFRLYLQMSLSDGHKTTSTTWKQVGMRAEVVFELTEKARHELTRRVEMMRDQLQSTSLSAGSYAILIDSDLGGMLAHEAFGHAAESDAVAENASVLGGKKQKFRAGDKVASDGVNIWDVEEEVAHGFHPYGSFGNARERVQLIKDGILAESISDVFTAGRIGVANKNCERSEGYYSVAIPRMSNTFVELEQSRLLDRIDDFDHLDLTQLHALLVREKLLTQHKKIIYLAQMTGGMVLPASGDFQFGTSFVYEFTQEGFTARQPVSFAGNILGALKSIDFGLGAIDKNSAGFCGKAGQRACVNTGGHQLLFFKPTKHIQIA